MLSIVRCSKQTDSWGYTTFQEHLLHMCMVLLNRLSNNKHMSMKRDFQIWHEAKAGDHDTEIQVYI